MGDVSVAPVPAPPGTESQPTPPPKKKSRARRWGMLAGLALIVVGAGVGYAAWYELVGKRFERTDNAYVQGHVVQITPQQAGTVFEIAGRDTDFVQAGQVLVRLDPSDARVALEQAEAQLAQTVREVRTLYGANDTLAAQIRARKAQATRAASEVQQLAGNFLRRRELAKSGLISAEDLKTAQKDLDGARSDLDAARAALSATRRQLSSSQSLTENTSVVDHPNVRQASALVHEAMLALDRTRLRAPVSGYIARRRVQLGQRVQPGEAMMAVIPLDQVWVDANFKENQLRQMRIGQPVELIADIYGSDVTYRGVIEGLGAGTGSAFALLPAQNATGNWIKIVQRIPVRVRLDPDMLAKHPLRIGLSMHATVQVDDTSGQVLATAPRAGGVEILRSSSSLAIETEAAVSAIIARNLGAENDESSAARKLAAGRSKRSKR